MERVSTYSPRSLLGASINSMHPSSLREIASKQKFQLYIIMEDLIKEKIEKYPRPLIGIVGATHPQRTGYDPRMGQENYWIRVKETWRKRKFLFTGELKELVSDVYKRGSFFLVNLRRNLHEKEPEDDRFLFDTYPSHLMNIMGEIWW